MASVMGQLQLPILPAAELGKGQNLNVSGHWGHAIIALLKFGWSFLKE
jgi:hypothetical protein